ncbi:RNA polymerase sigma factor [Caldisericum exile]|uniref:RNA polymerase ECF-type sigma factor n=1 Tax=Caldisericum exile (strain DSM 21853 / NBRC 104410 / AZM16c01) TaxID=511051 RepID=A0A7U6GFJ5_CALEA|nr:sigma-70 family RNA polymerase sigma factor [Caldisericum exile]BAL81478.1 RNA polymerase ECF-type sigma factor [Caldisericum exile AZM16c01]
MNESELIESLKKGDRTAKEILVRSTQDFLFNSVMQVCHDKELAEDVVVDTYLAAFKYIKNFKGESSIKTWLYRIARNILYKHYNKFKNIELRDDLVTFKNGEEKILDYETKELLYQAMEKIDPEDREIITLVDVEGLSYEDVSEILGVPLGTVKSRLYRARDKLRNILKDLGYF